MQTIQKPLAFRLSPQQRHLWRLLEELRPANGSPAPANSFTASVAVLVDGQIEAAVLRDAVEDVVARHEIFRTLFRKVSGMKLPVQQVVLDLAPIWRQLAPIAAPENGSRGAAVAELRVELAAQWDLREGPLVFAGWRPFEGGGGLLLLELPALLADVTGLDALVREIAATCAARATGEAPEAPELQYSDVAEWQLDLLENEETDHGRVYWSQKRLHRVSRPALPFAATAPAAGERDGAVGSVAVPFTDEVARALVQRAGELGAPPSALLLAAWQSLLYRFDPQEEFLLGVAFDGRSYEGLEETLGLLARSIPLVTAIHGSTPFSAVVEKAAKAVEEIQEWQEYFDWSELAVEGEERSEPFLPVGFEFTARPEALEEAGVRWQVIQRQATPEAFALQLRVSLGESGIQGAIFFDPQSMAGEDMERLAEQLAILCAGAASDPATPVARLPLLAPERRKEVLAALRGQARHPAVKPIHHLFEEQAAATPEAVAVQDDTASLTFAELRRRSRRIARHLRRKGVGPDVCVAVATERSCEMIAALMGVLQAGGAYLPLDPALPRERLALMLEDSAAPLLLTQESLRSQVPAGAEIVTLEEIEAIATAAEDDAPVPESGVGLDNLAYILFTSGSTGRPKGVGVAHRQLVHYAQNVAVNLDLPAGATFAMASTFASDLGNTAIFPPLIHGGTVRVLTGDEVADPAAFRAAMANGAVDCLKIVPSHLRALLTDDEPEASLPRQRLVIGGEAAYPDWVEKLLDWMPEGEVYNHYGPTETTVGVLAGPLVPVRQGRRSGALPLGRPIGDSRIYLVDRHLEPVPAWASGELLIGGSSVARGYVGRPGLTAERFIPDPFGDQPGARLYRTGDLVRMRPGGELDFLGRIDSQVKLRGFRVELGEVESHLRQIPGVREAVAGVHEEEGGSRCLVAWLVEERGAQLDDEALRSALLEKLPEVMVPAVFTRLESLPLNASGKVDRKALVPPRRARSTVDYVAPRTPEEEILAGIWTALLPVERVGIHDNFFKLGGDSILCIQVIARAGQAGVHLRPNQLFEQQTIAELAGVAQVSAAIDAEQGPVTGPAPLTPIQRRFFEQERAQPHHFNQSVLVTAPADLQPEALERAWSALLEHHDALRLRFHREDEHWHQQGGATGASILLQRVDLSGLEGKALESAWTDAAEALEASLDLRQGPLVRIGWGDRGRDEAGRLLLVVHHLVVDGVSWRILLEDMESAYRQLTTGTAGTRTDREVSLPSKTTSFARWAETLEAYAGSGALESDSGYWKRTLARAPKLPMDLEGGENDEGSTASVSIALDERTTAALLKDVHGAYNTKINDLLLTALAQAFAPWLGSEELLLDLEGHGREDGLFEGVNLSRTVGWFTAVYPLRLRLQNPSSPGDSLRQVKEQLRAVPRNGIDFGILRYLTTETAEKLRALGGSQVVFNYLGQFDQAVEEGSFGPTPGATGAQRSPRGNRPYLLEIIALVQGGRLRLEWIYSRNRHLQGTVKALADRFGSALETLVEHCRAPESGGFTPSDFPLASLTQQQLDRLVGAERESVEDFYPLSPMQKSLYLFGLQHPHSGVGVEQMSFSLRGDLDPEAFWQGWQAVLDRHPVLRTRFVGEGVPEPLQRVDRRVKLPRRQDDWRSRSPEAQEDGLQRFLAEDLRQGFDFASAPMLRITLLQETDDRWRFVFTRHHAILDGWSNVLLLQEGFLNYEALQRGGAVERLPAEPYRHYIEWLLRQDLREAEAFWRDRLHGFTRPTELRLPPPDGEAPAGAGRETRILPRQATAALEAMARDHAVTLNTLIQGGWALLLSRYSGRDQALFGHTVSGRPPELRQMEAMVGLFINNLPVPVRVPEDSPLESWLKGLQLQQMEAANFAYAPPERVQEWSEIPPARRFFDTLVVFENFPVGTADGSFEDHKPTLAMEDFDAPVKTGYQLTLVAVPGETLTLAVTYDRQRVAKDAVQQVLEDLVTLLEGFPDHAGDCLADHLGRITPPDAFIGEPEPALAERPPLVEPRNPVESAVAEVFAELLGLRPVGVHDDFFDLGGSSFLALTLVRRIREKVGQEIPLPALVGGTTVERLAEILRQSSSAGGILVPLQPEGKKPPIFLVHSAGGMIVNLLELARTVGRDRPLYALQDPRLAAEEEGEAGSVEALASAYLEEVRKVQEEGPYHLGGHSFGGVVAFEMARRLEEEGETVGSVLLLDSTAPAAAGEVPDDAGVLSHISAIFARFYGRQDPLTEEDLRALPEEQRIGKVLEGLGEMPDEAEHFTRFFHLYKDHMAALRRYAPAPYAGPVTLFRAEDRGEESFRGSAEDAANLGWSHHVGEGEVRMVTLPGDHTTMLRPPFVHGLAEAMVATVEGGRSAQGIGNDRDG